MYVSVWLNECKIVSPPDIPQIALKKFSFPILDQKLSGRRMFIVQAAYVIYMTFGDFCESPNSDFHTEWKYHERGGGGHNHSQFQSIVRSRCLCYLRNCLRWWAAKNDDNSTSLDPEHSVGHLNKLLYSCLAQYQWRADGL